MTNLAVDRILKLNNIMVTYDSLYTRDGICSETSFIWFDTALFVFYTLVSKCHV